jgi:hypothetical protein
MDMEFVYQCNYFESRIVRPGGSLLPDMGEYLNMKEAELQVELIANCHESMKFVGELGFKHDACMTGDDKNNLF